MKKFFEAVATLVCSLAMIVGILALLARPPIATVFPALHGTTPMVVLSGSMEPKIHTGSLVFVRPVGAKNVAVGDVIAFSTPEPWGDARELTTHRVVAITHDDNGGLAFKTKGDANDSPDPWTVSAGAVNGLAQASVPYLGYLSVFARGWFGFALLIGLPALLIVATEIGSIAREITGPKPCEDSETDRDGYELA